LTIDQYVGYNSLKKQGVDYMKGSTHYNKKSKRWFISVYWDGERHYIWNHPVTGEPFWHQKSAEKQLDRIRTEIDEGYFNPKHWKHGNPLWVKSYAPEWLKSINISQNTMRGYKSAVFNYIIPFLSDKDLRRITHKDIVQLHSWIPLTDKGKYNVVNVLKAMMRYAWRSEEIPRVPPFPKLSYQYPEIKALDFEQQKLILSKIPEHDRPIFIFMMESGCRPGEARSLQKDCIKENEILIKRAFSDNKLKETTKTKRIRYVPITERMRNILDCSKLYLSQFIFLNKNRKPYSANSLPLIWKKACQEANIEIRLYNATRHSWGCQIADMGYPLDVIQDQLGHSRADMTRRYAKRSINIRKEAANARGTVVEFRKYKENSG